jgi:hypothetical protein
MPFIPPQDFGDPFGSELTAEALKAKLLKPSRCGALWHILIKNILCQF